MPTKAHYVQELAGPGGFTMRVYPPKGDERAYNVRGPSCDCDGFSARVRAGEDCKHLGLVKRAASTIAGKEVSEEDAMATFKKIKKQLAAAVTNIKLVELSKAISGQVNLIKIAGEPKEPRATTRIVRAMVDEVRVEVTLF